jgi:CDP-diacylglycerol--glycerol-3-phosphate 3-phosphatidyltransferase
VDAACRPFTATAAAGVITLAVVLALRGVARTTVAETSSDPDAPLIGPRVRTWFRGVLAPLEDALVGWNVPPDAITWTQLVVSALAGAAFWGGAIFLGGWLTILAGVLDILDGGVARRCGVANARGALVDSLVDRYSEFLTFLGLGAFFRASPLLLAVAIAAFGSLMVSYTRARAEGLGLEMRAGQVQRPERYVILGFGGFLSGLVAHWTCALRGQPSHVVLGTALVLLAASSAWTAVRRAVLAVGALANGRRP